MTFFFDGLCLYFLAGSKKEQHDCVKLMTGNSFDPLDLRVSFIIVLLILTSLTLCTVVGNYFFTCTPLAIQSQTKNSPAPRNHKDFLAFSGISNLFVSDSISF